MTNATSVLVTAAASSEVAAAMLLLGQAPTPSSLLDDYRLTALCVLGAVVGAFLTVAVFPPSSNDERTKVRSLSAKFGASMAGGVAFTPMLIECCSLSTTPSMVLGMATAVAMVIVSVLHTVVPVFERAAARWLGRKIDDATKD